MTRKRRIGPSRRQFVTAAGVAGLASATSFASGHHAALAQATPSTVQDAVGALFIIVAAAGYLRPTDGGIFALTLKGLGPQVIYFTDAPDQRSASMEIEAAFSEIALDAEHANAALTATVNGVESVSLALELRSASYDPGSQTATMEAHLLNGFDPSTWHDGFRAPTLVIDDILSVASRPA